MTEAISLDKWIEKDLKYNWHPYTQMSGLREDPPLFIEKAEGIKLFDGEGRWYYDTISSWWCNVHGHGHPHIRRAIHNQMKKLDHVLFAGATHRPACRLAERLVKITPRGLDRVFYSDNGSTAVEVALKMSVKYQHLIGTPKKIDFCACVRAITAILSGR